MQSFEVVRSQLKNKMKSIVLLTRVI